MASLPPPIPTVARQVLCTPTSGWPVPHCCAIPETRRHIDYLENVQRGIYPRFNTASISAATRGFQVGGHASTPPPISRTDAMPGGTNTQLQNYTPGIATPDPQQAAINAGIFALLNKLSTDGIQATANINAREVTQKAANYESNIQASNY